MPNIGPVPRPEPFSKFWQCLCVLDAFQDERTEQELHANDLKTQMDELRALLAEANGRNEEKDLLIFEMEEKSQKLQGQIEANGKFLRHRLSLSPSSFDCF